jgi:hypothetical protein
MRGIMYPGDDGSEPQHIRDEKAEAYARNITRAIEDQHGAEQGNAGYAMALSVIISMLILVFGILLGTVFNTNEEAQDCLADQVEASKP